MELSVTQFVRPDGHKKPISCTIADDLAGKVQAMEDAGLRVTAEVIGPNVSFCIENFEEDLACEIVPNGPGILQAVEKMIREFDWPSAVANGDSKRENT